MKVWHITKSLHGGAGVYALRMSAALRDLGVDSRVLIADSQVQSGAVQLKPVKEIGIPFLTRVVRSLSHRMTSAPFHSLMNPEWYETEEMPSKGDVIHLHGLTGWMGLRALNKLIPDGSPVFGTTHDLWPLSGGCILYSECNGYQDHCKSCPILRVGTKQLARVELKMKEKFIRQHGIHPIANSRWMSCHIQKSKVFSGAQEVPIVPPIIDSAYFSDCIIDIRKQLNIPLDKFIVSLGARAVTDRFKGIFDFLKALSMRGNLKSKVVVLMFGEGELDIPSGLDVRAMGRIDSAMEMAEIYSSSHLFVSPSAMETFGMSLAEAQACGTPVAAFDVGGVRDAVCQQHNKYLVKNGDFSGLLDAVEDFATRPSKINEDRELIRVWAKEHFASKVLARRQKQIYENSMLG